MIAGSRFIDHLDPPRSGEDPVTSPQLRSLIDGFASLGPRYPTLDHPVLGVFCRSHLTRQCNHFLVMYCKFSYISLLGTHSYIACVTPDRLSMRSCPRSGSIHWRTCLPHLDHPSRSAPLGPYSTTRVVNSFLGFISFSGVARRKPPGGPVPSHRARRQCRRGDPVDAALSRTAQDPL